MSPKVNRAPPCNHCKSQHLKCDGEINAQCSNCKSRDIDCVRSKKAIRFRKAFGPTTDFSFSVDQTWLKPAPNKLHYVDETNPAKAKVSSIASPKNTLPVNRNRPPSQVQSSASCRTPKAPKESRFIRRQSTAYQTSPLDRPRYGSLSDGSPSSSTSNTASNPTESPATSSKLLSQGGDHRNSYPISASVSAPTILIPALGASKENTLSSTPPSTTSIDNAPRLGPSDTYFFSPTPSAVLSEVGNGAVYPRLQEACLIKYFAENLARPFETTDRDKHFSMVVPQRAMHSPLLFYAICTASARHLTRFPRKRNLSSFVEFDGIPLPGLDEKSAIHYHNVCISYLIKVADNSTQAYNEDALVAATILRFHEQIDTPLTGIDTEIYLNVVQAVINAQGNKCFGSAQIVEAPPRNPDVFASPSLSLHHSACLIALRQEIWSVLLYRRPFRLPIYTDNDYMTLSPGDEFAWTNRILLWCADILRFCFGDQNEVARDKSREATIERWKALKAFEHHWNKHQPVCFKPIYYERPDPTVGRYFPRIWQANDCQVIGLQHVEFARILLAVYNPKLQRLGLGANATNRKIEAQLRESTLVICGLALSNKKCQAPMVTAGVGVSMCGEYFHERREQKAIIEFMETLADEHAWPIETVVKTLADAWKVDVG